MKTTITGRPKRKWGSLADTFAAVPVGGVLVVEDNYEARCLLAAARNYGIKFAKAGLTLRRVA